MTRFGPRGFILETDHPIAADTVDHQHPHGTKNDNTRWPRFVAACERHFGAGLSVLDLGCAGGGLVSDFTERGHNAIGLEGSNYSLLSRRAEWPVIPDRLRTCDLRHPFAIWEIDGSLMQFDVVSAWDVLEHIPETALSTLLQNVRRHLKPSGVFTGTVSTRPSKPAPDGRNYHATVRDREWWRKRFYESGFVETEPPPFETEDYPRGNGINFPANFVVAPEQGFFVNLRPA